MQSRQIQKRLRKGSLIIECVIASAILGSCSIALLQWRQTGNQLRRQANTQTAAVLMADNAAARLNQTTIDNAATLATRVANELAAQQGLGVAIRTREFKRSQQKRADVRGIHFQITVSQGNIPLTVKHTWKLFTPDTLPLGGEVPSGTTPSASEKQEGPTNE